MYFILKYENNYRSFERNIRTITEFILLQCLLLLEQNNDNRK